MGCENALRHKVHFGAKSAFEGQRAEPSGAPVKAISRRSRPHEARDHHQRHSRDRSNRCRTLQNPAQRQHVALAPALSGKRSAPRQVLLIALGVSVTDRTPSDAKRSSTSRRYAVPEDIVVRVKRIDAEIITDAELNPGRRHDLHQPRRSSIASGLPPLCC